MPIYIKISKTHKKVNVKKRIVMDIWWRCGLEYEDLIYKDANRGNLKPKVETV